MCLVFAFAPALSLFVFHFLFCSVLQEISARFLFSYGSSSWIFPYKQVLLFLYPVEVPMYFFYYYLCLCAYVLHFPLCLDIRYLCVHLPHRFAVLLASLRLEENYMFWFLTENCWATELPMEETGQRPEQSLIESSHTRSNRLILYNLFRTDLMKGCPRSSHDTISQPCSRSFNQLP